jgi:hypothetical protein
MTSRAADSAQSAAPAAQADTDFGNTLADASGEPPEYSVSPLLRQLFPGGSLPAAGFSCEPQDPVSPLLRQLFPGVSVAAEPVPAPPAPPTAEELFGPSPWLANPTEKLPDGRELSLNPYYFATPETAAVVAGMLGGEVVEMNMFTAEGSPVAQQQPNQMVRMPDGRLVNAGLVASYYDLGLPQSYIDQLVADIESPHFC